MKEEIRTELSDMGSSLAGSRVGMPYGVPDGYFSAFSETVESLLAGESDLNPDLFGTRQLPYELPEKYFDSFPARLVANVKVEKPKGITISFGQLRWAAAAVLLLAIGLGTYNMLPGSGSLSKNEGLLSNVGDNDIREYLVTTYHSPGLPAANNAYLDEVDLDTKDIIAYLDETGWNLD